MEDLLKVENVTKKYSSTIALDNINLNIGKGKIIGLLGSNGSGKTTLLKLIAGILRCNSGKITVMGKDIGVETKEIVSFMSDKHYFEKWMKISDTIDFYKDFYKDFDEKKALKMLEFMNLNVEQRVSALSKGMAEKLQLTLVLSRKAKLYLLDEPIGGVDPVGRDKILDAIINFYDEDSTIIFSTHLIRDVERIFDEVIFIKEGRVILYDNVEDIRIKENISIHDKFKEVYGEC
ncbi:MAG: ABC transporter ATP-binding protein [Clostridium argentinense]|uniref:ABC transporter ATP-binding protein n=1 Tax=Clostridium faecium TaxID=2762223 RepID=A0ABR8YQZ8_9CLOT|nr:MULTISPECIES: ABC transporter ATP-binding protein [Clostridium]MBD8046653.1 ABC transporter ATP-binding protein [Clostridium faecium]MBS5824313.1 ABC transporter ATP-binding protein [Clostridium argentinense]MDU1349333.1 ABC transporter ATP-binding protein [Clostridium argentinense]